MRNYCQQKQRSKLLLRGRLTFFKIQKIHLTYNEFIQTFTSLQTFA